MSETSPLIRPSDNVNGSSTAAPALPSPTTSRRTVTFNPTISTNNYPQNTSATRTQTGSTGHDISRQSVPSTLNNMLRRRHSSGSPLIANPQMPKAGAQRTTKTVQKLKLLPNPDHGDDGPDEESGRDVYSQFTRIKDPTARRDAARLGKEDREKLPRVSAYCTANSYRMDELLKFLKSRAKQRGTAPKLFDECIYSPFSYGKSLEEETDPVNDIPQRERSFSDSALEIDQSSEQQRPRFMDLHSDSVDDITSGNGESASLNRTPEEIQIAQQPISENPDFDTQVHTPEVFLFAYGTVVIWGMTLKEEKRFLKDIAKFETEKLSKEDVQTENFNFYYTREYQARIYNDFISLREKKNYMTKLAISHALSQSVKTSLYEDLVDNTIEETKEIPEQIASTGKVNMSRKEINMQIGELFILRISIHLQGSVLDAPELMWAEPQLDPIYQAVRSYLEMDQRVGLLTERLEVIADLLAVLKDQLSHTHGETLEWIVIVLIAAEILVAAINIIVDVWAGGD